MMKNTADCCQRILFDSKSPKHKSPFGCIYEDEKCTLTVTVPNSCPVVRAFAEITREDGLVLRVPMKKTSENDSYTDFSGEFALYESGLYFYTFLF